METTVSTNNISIKINAPVPVQEKNYISILNIDSFLNDNRKVWIINRTKPAVPLVKISYNLYEEIKSGHFRSQTNPIKFNGITYWLNNELRNKIKEPLVNLGISLKEYIMPEPENTTYTVEDFNFIKNIDTDVIIITAMYTKQYQKLFDRLIDDMKRMGIKVVELAYLTNNFRNNNKQKINTIKENIILQYVSGYKITDGKFTEKTKGYTDIKFYDNDIDMYLQEKFNILLKNSDKEIRNDILKIKMSDKNILFETITGNELNKFIEEKINIIYPNNLIYIKNFESFKYKQLNESIEKIERSIKLKKLTNDKLTLPEEKYNNTINFLKEKIETLKKKETQQAIIYSSPTSKNTFVELIRYDKLLKNIIISDRFLMSQLLNDFEYGNAMQMVKNYLIEPLGLGDKYHQIIIR